MGGIPISKYIDIQTRTIAARSGNPDFSCLVFTADNINTGSALKTDYDAGKVITLDLGGIEANFASSTSIYGFATKYFGYSSRVSAIHVRKILTAETDCKTAFNNVTKDFNNFGTVTFLGKSHADVKSLATDVIEGSDYALLVYDTKTNAVTGANALGSLNNTFLVIGDADACWMPAAWYAAVDYNELGSAAGTIDYKVFAGVDASVTSGTDKDTFDAKHINYIGQVQGRGIERKFMQCGTMLNGEDFGVFRDKMWLKSLAEQGWFNLNDEATVPASAEGASRVRTMLLGVANRGVNAGAILIDKPLDDEQVVRINQITGNENASVAVATSGFYIDAQIAIRGEKYICEYILIYAKGDHISSLSGVHYLV